MNTGRTRICLVSSVRGNVEKALNKKPRLDTWTNGTSRPSPYHPAIG